MVLFPFSKPTCRRFLRHLPPALQNQLAVDFYDTFHRHSKTILPSISTLTHNQANSVVIKNTIILNIIHKRVHNITENTCTAMIANVMSIFYITLVKPRHFLLKCPYQDRKVSGHFLIIPAIKVRWNGWICDILIHNEIKQNLSPEHKLLLDSLGIQNQYHHTLIHGHVLKGGVESWSGVLETPSWSGVLKTPSWSVVYDFSVDVFTYI
jgi:hypothetical protein